MNNIPIVFAIDNNVVMQCGVTITSLLMNAEAGTFYDIYILCDHAQLLDSNKRLLHQVFDNEKLCKITFVDVGESFKESEGLTEGHITTATYFRLAIPTLFPQYNKVLYADIDMIFQQDLSELYQSSLQNNELVAAALDLAIDDKYFFRSNLPAKIGKSEKDYFNAGFLVMNLGQMRGTEVQEELRRHAKIKYEMNDQDVLNIVCNGKVQILPSMYNFQPGHFANFLWHKDKSEIGFDRLFKKATLHYTGKLKPWNSLECVASDTWWHYYKMSPFYDDLTYFRRQYEQIESYKNDYRVKSNKQLLTRVIVNIKHKLFG